MRDLLVPGLLAFALLIAISTIVGIVGQKQSTPSEGVVKRTVYDIEGTPSRAAKYVFPDGTTCYGPVGSDKSFCFRS